jgi:hypothetical protein
MDIHWDFFLQLATFPNSSRIRLGIELYDGAIEIKLDMRSKGVDNGLRIPVPVAKGWRPPFGTKSVGLYPVQAVVIASNKKFARVGIFG